MTEYRPAMALVAERDNPKLGIWVFLGSEAVFFLALILTNVYIRLHDPAGYALARPFLDIPLVAFNTLVLIASSYMVVRALEAIRKGSLRGLRANLIGVGILGAMFLGGQAVEWTLLFRAGVSVTSTFGTPFFTLTGIHGTHVFIGLIWLALVLASALRGAYSRENHRGVEAFGLYWHFVDVVWIILFTLFYLVY